MKAKTKLLLTLLLLAGATLTGRAANYPLIHEGFETGIPATWTQQVVTANSQLWVVESENLSYPTTAKEGNARARFFVENSTQAYHTQLITPAVDMTVFTTDAREPELNFWMANVGRNANQVYDTLYIKVRTAASADWITIGTINTAHEQWTYYSYDLSAYKASTAFQVAFEAAHGQGRGIVLDEVKLTIKSECGLAPTILVSGITETTATISWNGVTEAYQSQVKVSTTELTDFSARANVVDTTLEDIRQYNITGLQPGTYYVYVRNYCGFDDYTPWAAVSFTANKSYPVPFSEDLESYTTITGASTYTRPDQGTQNLPTDWSYWTNILRQNTLYASYYMYLPRIANGTTAAFNPSGVAGQNRVIYMYGYFNSSSNMWYEPVVITPRFAVDDISKLVVEFDYRFSHITDNTTFEVGVVDDPSQVGSFTPVATIAARDLGSQGTTAAWKHVSVSLAEYTGTGKYIAFKQTAPQDKLLHYVIQSSSTPGYLDNIKIDYEANVANYVSVIRAKAVTDKSVDLAWYGKGTFDVRLFDTAQEAPFTATGAVASADGLTTNAYTATGLKGGKTYYAYVRLAGADTWQTTFVHTDVPAAGLDIPYEEKFEGYGWMAPANSTSQTGAANGLPVGWTFYRTYGTYTTTSTGVNWPRMASVANSTYDGAGLQIGGNPATPTVVALPPMSKELNKLQLSFKYLNSTNVTATVKGMLIVGALEDPDDYTTMTPIDTLLINEAMAWETVLMPLSRYTGTSRTLVLWASAQQSSMFAGVIDNIVLEDLPSCLQPKELTASDTKSSTTVLNWGSRGSETAWDVDFGPVGHTPGTGTIRTVTTRPYTLEGLEGGTYYEIYVRANCGAADGTSTWEGPVKILTLVSPANADNYTTNFSDQAENAKWMMMNGTTVNKWIVGNKFPMNEGDNALYLSNDGESFAIGGTGQHNEWAYRSMHFKEGTYELSFNWKGWGGGLYSNPASGFLRAFLVPTNELLDADDYAKHGSINYNTIPGNVAALTGWIDIVNATNQWNSTTLNNTYCHMDGDSTWSNGWNESRIQVYIPAEADYNLAFYFKSNLTASTKRTSIAIDNISVKRVEAGYPQVTADVDLLPSSRVRLDIKSGSGKYDIRVLNKSLVTDRRQNTGTASSYAAYSKSTVTTNLSKLENMKIESDTMMYLVNDFTGTSILVEGLEANTTYQVYARSVATDGTKGEWQRSQFTTGRKFATPYVEDFGMATNNTWNALFTRILSSQNGNATRTMEQIFRGEPQSTTVAPSGWTMVASNSTTDRCYTGDRFIYTYNHISSTSAGYDTLRHWLYSPMIYVQEAGNEVTADICVVGRQTTYNGEANNCTADGYLPLTNDGVKYGVLISRDNGRTWKPEDAMLWVAYNEDEKTADGTLTRLDSIRREWNFYSLNPARNIMPQYNGLTDKYYRVKMPADAFVGDTIQIAFYVGSTYKGSTSANDIGELYVTRLSVEPKSLDLPSAITVTNTDLNKVTLDWKSTDATQWRIKAHPYNLNDVDNQEALMDVTVSSHPTTLTFPKAGHPYMVYIQAINGTMKSAFSSATRIETGCYTIDSLPFTETFDDYNTEYNYSTGKFTYYNAIAASNILMPCWPRSANPATNSSGNDIARQYVFLYDVYQHTQGGTGAMNLYTLGSSDKAALTITTPEITADSIHKLQVEFWFLPNFMAGDNATFEIGIEADGDRTPLATYAVSKALMQNTWQKITLPLNSYKGTVSQVSVWDETLEDFVMRDSVKYGNRIYFTGTPNITVPTSNCRFYIDDLTIDRISECTPPVLGVDSAIGKSVYFSITDPAHTRWDVRMSKSYLSEAELAAGTNCVYSADGLTTRTFSVNDLTPGSYYQTYVRTYCTSGATEWSTPISVMAACADSLDLPYFEDFEGWNGTFSPCWNRINASSNASASDNVHGTLYSTVTYEGNYCLYSTATTAAKVGYTVLPRLNASLDTVVMTMMLNFPTTAANMANATHSQVGVMTDPEDITTFTPVYNLVPTQAAGTNSRVWEPVTISFDQYKGTGKYIAFKFAYYGYVYIDSLTVRGNACQAPISSWTSQPTDTSLTFTWIDRYNQDVDYEVEYGLQGHEAGTGTTLTIHGGAADTLTTTLTGLQANTWYDVYVRTACTAADKSPWRGPVSGHTTAVPATVPYYNNFTDATEVGAWTMANYAAERKSWWYINQAPAGTRLNAWVINDAAGRPALHATLDGTSYQDTTLNGTVYAYRTIELQKGKYDLAIDWKGDAHKADGTTMNGYNYIAALIAPTSDEIEAEYNFYTSANTRPSYYNATSAMRPGWKYITPALKGNTDFGLSKNTFSVPEDGRYNLVVIYSSLIGFNSSTNILEPVRIAPAVDSISIERSLCDEPDSIVATAAPSGTEASLSWTGGVGSYQVILSTSKQTLDSMLYAAKLNSYVVLDTVVDQPSLAISGLKPNSTYYYYVRTLCDVDSVFVGDFNYYTTGTNKTRGNTSGYRSGAWFKTPYAPRTMPFVEDFTTFAAQAYQLPVSGSMNDWKFYNVKLEDVLAGTADYTTTAGQSESMAGGHYRRYDDCALPGGHMAINVFTARELNGANSIIRDANKLILLPNIAVTQDNPHFTFDLALSQAIHHGTIHSDSCDRFSATNNLDDRFVVLLSRNNGDSWSVLRTWDNVSELDATHARFNDIPYMGNLVDIDLSAYRGDTVKLAFYGESTLMNAYGVIHIDNVRLTSVVEKTIDGTACAGYLYEGEGFTLAAEQVLYSTEPQYFARYVTGSAVDTVVNLSLLVGRQSSDTIRATICQGETYTLGGFSASTEGEHIQYGTTALTGCDSTTVLYLTVNPAYHFEDSLTICQQQTPYEWHGQQLTQSGTYYDNQKTALGCDSVYTFRLSVMDNFKYEYSVGICQGQNYSFGGRLLTQTGVYSDTVQNSLGCDSINVLHLTVNPTYNQYDQRTLCTGDSLVIDGRTFKTNGSYTLSYRTVGGCDSIINLSVNVINTSIAQVRDTINRGESYYFGGLGRDEAGIYMDTTTNAYGCDSITILTLVVRDNSGLLDRSASTVTLVPNPIERGGSVTINHDFTAAQRAGLKVEVFNLTGAKVRELRPGESRLIVVDGFDTDGIYLVRVTTGLGETYLGRVLVK